MDPIDELTAGVDAYIAALPEPEFTALVARTREPRDDTTPRSAGGAGRAEAQRRYGKKGGTR